MRHLVFLGILAFAALTLAAYGGPRTAGPGETEIVPLADGASRCIEYHHDDGFEEPLAWDYGGVQEPYYGAFGEAFLIESTELNGIMLWLSQDGLYQGQLFDLYVWEGGYFEEPSEVLFMEPGLEPQNLPIWPEVGENYYGIELFVSYDATAGFWGDWPGQAAGFFVAADTTGADSTASWSPGHPWTHIAPGLPWPSGWQHPDVVWGRRHIEALGIGVDYERPPSPPESRTWGAVKSLFR